MPSSDLTQYFFNMSDIRNSFGESSLENSICLEQDLSLEGPYFLTLDGVAVVDDVATFNTAAPVRILTYYGDLSEISYTITGTDVNDDPLVESIFGPSGDPQTVNTVNYFKTVSSIEVTGGDGVEKLGFVGITDAGAIKVFDGPGRIRSIYYSPDGSSSTPVVFYKNSLSGDVGFSFRPGGTSTNILFPDMGVRFPDSCYLVWPDPGAFRSLSVMVA